MSGAPTGTQSGQPHRMFRAVMRLTHPHLFQTKTGQIIMHCCANATTYAVLQLCYPVNAQRLQWLIPHT
jgi:hypothetical protein